MSDGAIPESVRLLLNNCSYLHLATCLENVPHVSLMNYTFISNEGEFKDTILITTPKNTKKFENLKENNKCSLLIHDFTTSNNSTASDVLNFLQSLNQNEIGDKSVTLNGHVIKYLLDKGTDEYNHFKELHLSKHPNAKCFIEGDDIALLLIKIEESKVSDSHNNVENFK